MAEIGRPINFFKEKKQGLVLNWEDCSQSEKSVCVCMCVFDKA